MRSNQKKLKEILEEAAEWDRARSDARMEAETDWELVCRFAEATCSHSGACSYAQSVATFFAANEASICQRHLAEALRSIICSGPSKTTRVPLVTGPTNSGKTTLFLPFDDLFGFHKVFHKPALGSKFALWNILRDKRFLFFDDFRPVEYAQETLPVSAFLSLFQGQPLEAQVSQAFNDGNVDFEWHRGCLMTAKADGLWTPLGAVSQEDIRHMQSRVVVSLPQPPSGDYETLCRVSAVSATGSVNLQGSRMRWPFWRPQCCAMLLTGTYLAWMPWPSGHGSLQPSWSSWLWVWRMSESLRRRTGRA